MQTGEPEPEQELEPELVQGQLPEPDRLHRLQGRKSSSGHCPSSDRCPSSCRYERFRSAGPVLLPEEAGCWLEERPELLAVPVEERAEEQSEGLSEVRPEALPEEQEQPAVSGLSRHREPAAGRCRCLGAT